MDRSDQIKRKGHTWAQAGTRSQSPAGTVVRAYRWQRRAWRLQRHPSPNLESGWRDTALSHNPTLEIDPCFVHVSFDAQATVVISSEYAVRCAKGHPLSRIIVEVLFHF